MTRKRPPSTEGPGRPNAAAREARKASADGFGAFGEPPDDPLAASGWMARHLLLGFRKVAVDPTLSDKVRLDRLQKLAKTIRSLIPDERKIAAEQAVKNQLAELEKTRTGTKVRAWRRAPKVDDAQGEPSEPGVEGPR